MRPAGVLRALRQKVLPHWTDLWPEMVASAQKGKVLHLGPGRSPLPGAVTTDINPSTKPDMVYDLNLKPWPFKDSTFDGVVALSILEHLDDFLGVMAEIHRVSKAGAVTSMLVPHFSSISAFTDPTHKQRLSALSCDYFISGSELEREYGFYVPFRFQLVRRYIHLQGGFRYIPGAEWFAGHYPVYWEAYLCYLVRGSGVFWQLRAVK